MKGEKIGGGGSGSKFETSLADDIKRQNSSAAFDAEINQKKADEAAQAAQSAIAAAKRQENQTAVAEKKSKDDHSQYIDLHSGMVETDRIDHEDKKENAPEKQELKNDLEQLSDAELKARSKEATTRLTGTTLNTPEFEEARRQVLEIAKEKNNRYRARKEQEKNTDFHSQETQKIDPATAAAAAAVVDRAVASAEQPEEIINPIKAPSESENEKLSLRERLKKTKVWKKVVSGVVATALLVGAVGVGVKALNDIKPDEAHADIRIEQEHNAEIKVGSPESYRGIFADDSGETYNPNKTGKFNYGPSIEDIANDSAAVKVKMQRAEKTPEVLADHLQGLHSDKLERLGIRADMSMLEIEQVLQSSEDINQAAYDIYQNDLFNDQATITTSRVTGTYDNAYMAKINDSGRADEKGNVQLVKCTTQEDNTLVFVVKYADGTQKIYKAKCWTQGLAPQGQLNIGNVPTVTPDSPTPTPVPPGPTPVPPGPTPQPKGSDAHSGGEEVPLSVTPINPSANYIEATPNNHVTGGGDTKANPDSSGPNQSHTDQELSDIWKQHQGK